VLQHLRSAREKKVALSDKLSPIGQLFTIVDKAVDRLDIISVEVKQMNARVLTWEREVADLRSMKDPMGERVETLNRGVENLQAAGGRLGALKARMATQRRETN